MMHTTKAKKGYTEMSAGAVTRFNAATAVSHQIDQAAAIAQ